MEEFDSGSGREEHSAMTAAQNTASGLLRRGAPIAGTHKAESGGTSARGVHTVTYSFIRVPTVCSHVSLGNFGLKRKNLAPGSKALTKSKPLRSLCSKLLWECRGFCRRDFASGWEVEWDDPYGLLAPIIL